MRLLAVLTFFCAIAHLNADLVSSQKVGTITEATADQWIASYMKGLGMSLSTSDIDLYKITYTSTDLKGAPTTLSGLVALPTEGAPKGLVVCCHGTISDNAAAPSRYTGDDNKSESQIASVVFGAGGYAVAMPDYLGLGDSSGVHPYPLGDVNSKSAIDMIGAARELGVKQHSMIGRKLYVTGYSEGGAVAMWTVRNLEGTANAPTLAAPLSGPYDLSSVMLKFLVGETSHAEVLAFKMFVLGYSVYSICTNYGLDINNYFAPSFASYVPYLFNEQLSDEQMAKKMMVKGMQMGTMKSVKRVVDSKFWDEVNKIDSSDPLVEVMKDNDCFNWSPKTKMILVYLTTDQFVPPANTEMTIQAMRSNGVSEDTVRTYPITTAGLTHITAAPTAMVAARKFFDGGFTAIAK